MKVLKFEIKKLKKMFALTFFVSAAFSFFALPAKRGLCYNELNEAELSALKEGGVAWGYNWAGSEENPEIGGDAFAFMPMVWGGGEDFEDMFSKAEAYLSSHPEAEFLLGFNEPMMKNQYGGCDMTPHEAALLWPRLEKLAEKYKVALVSPALTWGFEPLTGDGKIYVAPEDWMNAWAEEYKALYGRLPHYDYLALHSYMDYPSAVMWFCNHYSAYFNKPVLLTEFCAWDSDQNQTPHKSEQGQISSMSQKIEALDANENVAGYAWFMSHAEVTKVPYNSVFIQKGADGKMTRLGKIYSHQSRLDKKKIFTNGDIIPACSYVSSSNYNTTVGEKAEDGVRFNTPLGIDLNSDKKSEKNIPLEIGDFTSRRFASYLVNVAESKTYTLTVRYQSDKEQQLFVTAGGKEVLHGLLKPVKKWSQASFEISLEEGEQIIQLKSLGNAKSVKLVWFSIK